MNDPQYFGVGTFPAVAFIDGAVTTVFMRWANGAPTGLVTMRHGNEVGFLPMTGSQGFPSLDNDGNLAYVDGNKRGVVNGRGIGRLYDCNRPILVGYGWVVYQKSDDNNVPLGVFRQDVDGSSEVLLTTDSRPTGLSYVTPDGGFVFWDDNRLSLWKPIINPAYAGDFAVGQADKPIMGLIAKWGDDYGATLQGVQWNDTSVCADGPDSVAFAAWTPDGNVVLYSGVTRADVASWPAPGEVPMPEPPTPIPPTPQPPEVPMILTADFVNNHPAQSVLGQGANEHERRENALRFCNTVARDANIQEPATRYGLLSKESGANAFGYAADIIFDFVTGDHFDVVRASESADASPSFQNHGQADRQRWRKTDPRYYVGGPVEPPTPGPEPPTPQPPVPGQPTNADIYAAIARLQASFDRVFR